MPAGDPYCSVHGQTPCMCLDAIKDNIANKCAHANEVSYQCSCSPECYCRDKTCLSATSTPSQEKSVYQQTDKEVVNVYFENYRTIYKFVIEYYPQATGDVYKGISLDTGKRYIIQNFSYMEVVKLSDPDDEVPF